MNNNILLSKIAASPTDNTWSQAYSTLNLYIVLSIKAEGEDEIVNAGKEMFEKIQREYFSLDDKNLKNIKNGVETAIEAFDESKTISLVLATIKNDILYIITAGNAETVMKRGEKIGTIAKGEAGQVVAFSGKLTADDTIIIETEDFAKKIPIDKLSQNLKNQEVTEVSESLAPIIHENAIGTEAALVLQYKGEATKKIASEQESVSKEPEKNDEVTEDIENKKEPKINISGVSNLSKLPIKIPSFKNMERNKLILVGIVVLVIVLALSIFFEGMRQQNAKVDVMLEELLAPAEKTFDEAISLMSLNEGLALEEFQKLKESLEAEREKFGENSSQLKELDEFIGKVESEIGKITEGSAITNQEKIFENAQISVFRDGRLFAVDDKGTINVLDENGNSEDEIETDNASPNAITANEASVYVLGDEGITRTTISNGNTNNIIEDVAATISIDLFGSNIYGLNSKTNSIDKYTGASFARSDYLDEDVELANPSHMAIDGSIWVVDDGKIRKFTRGAEDSFTVSGLNLSNNSLIFTSIDYDNLYIVDKDSSKIYILSKDGDIKNQFIWQELSSATSISADEESNTIYVTTDGKLYSFIFE